MAEFHGMSEGVHIRLLNSDALLRRWSHPLITDHDRKGAARHALREIRFLRQLLGDTNETETIALNARIERWQQVQWSLDHE